MRWVHYLVTHFYTPDSVSSFWELSARFELLLSCDALILILYFVLYEREMNWIYIYLIKFLSINYNKTQCRDYRRHMAAFLFSMSSFHWNGKLFLLSILIGNYAKTKRISMRCIIVEELKYQIGNWLNFLL